MIVICFSPLFIILHPFVAGQIKPTQNQAFFRSELGCYIILSGDDEAKESLPGLNEL